MSPLREFRSLASRYEDEVQIEPLRRYYLIFEGSNTEPKYFQGIDDCRKELGIHSQIELVLLRKEGDISSFSHPKKLLELIEEKKKILKRDGKFDRTIDHFVIVFDRDSYETAEEYVRFVALASVDHILAVTSPCFELWLILHIEGAFPTAVLTNQELLFENRKVSNAHTYASRLFSELSGVNPKSESFFNKLKGGIDRAIELEKSLEQDSLRMATELGSNIGRLIEQLREDPRETFLYP